MKKIALIVAFAFCVSAIPAAKAAAEEDSKVFSIYWENDVFAGTDRDYSNGLRLSWSRPYNVPEDEEPGFSDKMIQRLPLVNNPESSRNTFFTFGQNVYTPADTGASELIVDDRPYAGFIYLTFGVHADEGDRRSVWEFDIGLVGPWALAQESQDFVHDLIDTSKSEGWEHQLNNELTLGVALESKWRLWETRIGERFGIELIPHLGGHFGNAAIYANTGAELRFGWFLPNNFGTCPIRPGCDAGELKDLNGYHQPMDGWGIHFFVAVDGRAVLHDIFLDGNTFQDSHSVDKEPFVADLMTGVAVHYKALQISYAYIQRSREFEQQDKAPAFGAVKISYFY